MTPDSQPSVSTDWPTRDLLAHRFDATPDRIGVVDTASGREWSYRGLDAAVDRTAARLWDALTEDVAGETDASSRDGQSRRVTVLVSTRVAFVVAFHAALRIGVESAPLNVRLSERELRERAARLGSDLLVCERDTESVALDVADCPVVSLDSPEDGAVGYLPTVEEEPDCRGGRVEPARWGRHETAVLLFTSGTTGEPKCVRLTLGNLVASATASAFRLGVDPDDRWFDCLPVYHMGGLAPLVRCPLYGTTLLVGDGFDAGPTGHAIAEYEATGVSLVPTQLRRLLDEGWHPPESLDTVLLGGAPADEKLLKRALGAGVPVCPTYGLTETASQVATATPSVAREYPSSVGQPLLFTEVTVLGDGTPVEPGETGELVIDGPTVTPGYLDEERSEAAFGDHGLHTGDVGHRDGDGRLWVVGRLDDTIVTGGENVHPGAVEEILCEHPAVADVAVVGLPDEEWGERVAALVVSDGVSTDELRSFARERLAGYKLPRTIGFTSTLPRTASGTVDRAVVRERLED